MSKKQKFIDFVEENLMSKLIEKSLFLKIITSYSTKKPKPIEQIISMIGINKPSIALNEPPLTIIDAIENFSVTITGKNPIGEIVTSGGTDLKEINSKTMELKKYPNIYCCGEVIDIDGFCGGFNLQNCWSGAYVTALAISQKENLH